MSSLTSVVCPNFPSDRKTKETTDSQSWYRIRAVDRTLMVPPIKVLKCNPWELDKFIEAVQHFAEADLESPRYRWTDDDLELSEYGGEAGCLRGIAEIKREGLLSGEIACDIETRHAQWNHNILLSIGFAVTENKCIALYDIPIRGSVCCERDHCERSTSVYDALQDLFSTPGIVWTWQNGKFDCGKLKYLCNIDARVDEDTMLMHYACVNEKKGTHGLKDLGQLYLQAPAWDAELDRTKKEWCRKNKTVLADFMYDFLPVSTLIPYMQRDCIATRRLRPVFASIARPGSDFIYRKLIEASNAYLRVELAGVHIDLDYLEELEYELDVKIEAGQKRIQKVAQQVWDPRLYQQETGAKGLPGAVFNIGSPAQLKWMFKQLLGYAVPSTDKNMIAQLVAEVKAGYITDELAREFILSIGDTRKYAKYMKTYVLGMRKVVCADERVRGTFNLHGTETGRLSSTNPNMQNIPRDATIKNLIVAKKGYKLLQLDYSQAELRVLAVLSDDPYLVQVYLDGRDLHDAIATEMFGSEFTREQRNMAKSINFGIAYGRGPSSIAKNFNRTVEEARAIIAKWYKPMPKVKQYIDGQRNKVRKSAPCVTLFGRERHFVVTDENFNHVQNEYINTPVQSTASDLTMFSLLEIDRYLLEHPEIDARIVTTVHDSIILEVVDDDDVLRLLAEVCTRIMSSVPERFIENLRVPFKADADTGYRWGDMHDIDLGDEEDDDEAGEYEAV